MDEQRSSTLVMTMTKTMYLVMRRLGPVRELALVLVPAPSLRLLVLLRLPLTVLPRPLQWRMLGLLVAPPAPPQRLMATTMGGRRQGVGAGVGGAAEDMRGKGNTHTHTPFDNANASYFSVLAHTTLICTATRVFPSMSTSTLAGCIVTAMPSGRKNSRDSAIARTACRMLSAPTLTVATCFPDRIIPLIAPATWEASLAPATFTCLTSADLSHAHEYHVEPQPTGATSKTTTHFAPSGGSVSTSRLP